MMKKTERKCTHTQAVALIVILAVFGSACFAGEVLLKNGDRLTGTVEKIVDGKLHLKSDIVGAVTIDMKNVKTFTTDKPEKIVLTDGSILNQQITGADDGQVTLSGGQIVKGQDLKLADITAVNPPPKVPNKWKGSISVGWTSVHGNTKSETLQASISSSLRRENDRTSAGIDYGKAKVQDPATGDKKTTEDWWRARGKYDYFVSEKMYGFFEGRYETDQIANLDRRIIVGAGAGYQWIESDPMNFSTEFGLAHLSERFNGATSSNNKVSAQAGYHFDIKLTDRIDFINDLTYYPSIEDFSDYYLTTTAELRTSLTEKMFANFRTIFDYDTSPANGKGRTDVKYILGVGWNF
jgi:putative salt-induced outer membrane protein YdiY